MKLGLFYQSANNYVACYMATRQFRKFYPDAPVAFWEDAPDSNLIYQPIAEEFNLDYKTTGWDNVGALRYKTPAGALKYLDRVAHSCSTTLSDVDWVVNFEDDVWTNKRAKGPPPWDFAGANNCVWTPQLIEYLEERLETKIEKHFHSKRGSLFNYGMHGGTIFNREKFLEAYADVSTIDWDYIQLLDYRVTGFTDALLTFLCVSAGFTYGYWDDHDWRNEGRNTTKAFTHPFKKYYRYPKEKLARAIKEEP